MIIDYCQCSPNYAINKLLSKHTILTDDCTCTSEPDRMINDYKFLIVLKINLVCVSEFQSKKLY